jgi:hypothetical protein
MSGPWIQKIDNDPGDQGDLGGFSAASRPESRNALREGLDWSISCEPHSSFDCGCPEWAQAIDVSK